MSPARGGRPEDMTSDAGPVKGPASYFPSIERTYGKPIEHWTSIVRAAGPRKHMELVSLLKTEHGLGHGHANAIVAHVRSEDG
ncbi:unannotated protein [freshwater metagenome]|uniref:Unannotated protein n=1 Tax=freshwater metagenome TaxID=449393 RepID=A0A6J7K9R4_9ZZZZ